MSFRELYVGIARIGLWGYPISNDGAKLPLVKWKQFQERPPTPDEIAGWCKRFPQAGIGIPTGRATGFFIVDADDADAIAFLEGRSMPETWTVRTRRGRHYYFKHPDFVVKNSASAIAHHVDVRGRGGFGVGPGSLGKDGFVYAWEPGCSPAGVPLAAAPDWLLDLLRPKPEPERPHADPKPFSGQMSAHARKALEGELDRLRNAGEGTRNDTAMRVAFNLGRLIAGGELSDHEVRGALNQIANGWPNSSKTRDTINRALEAGKAHPRNRPQKQKDVGGGDEGKMKSTARAAARHNDEEPAGPDVQDLPTLVRDALVIYGGKAFDKRRAAAGLVRRALLEDGHLCRTEGGSLYYFRRSERRLYDIQTAEMDHLVTAISGLSRTEEEHKFLLATLQAEAARTEPVAVYTLSHYDTRTGRLSVSDGGAGVWTKTQGGVWTLGSNGDNGLLFLNDSDSEPYTPDFAADGGQLDWLVGQFLFDDRPGYSIQDQRTLLLVHILHQFFDTRRKTRLIPSLLGPQGSGKTTGARLVGRQIVGLRFDVTKISEKKEADFIATMSAHTVAAFDNADNRITWLEDSLASYATGVRYRMRQLYTTNTEVSFDPRAMAMITSRDPHFKRPDVAERLLPLYFARPKLYVDEEKIWTELQRRRNAIWGELLTMLGAIADTLHRVEAPSLPFRMADYAAFGWAVFQPSGETDEWIALLSRLTAAQAGFAASDNSLIEILRHMLDTGDGRIGPVLTGVLFTDAKRVAEAKGYPFFKSPQGFGKALDSMKQIIEIELDVKMVEESAGGNRREISIVKKVGKTQKAAQNGYGSYAS
jgi:Bifunctional DNA primase/polymerase, N-terminal